MDGSLSDPVAHTSTGAAYSSPPIVRTTQRAGLVVPARLVDRPAEAQMSAHVEAVDAGAHVVPDLALRGERRATSRD